MTKKLLFGFAMLALVAVIFGMTEPVYAASPGWQTTYGNLADTALPYHASADPELAGPNGEIRDLNMATGGVEIPSCQMGAISFGNEQVHLLESNHSGAFARVRIVDVDGSKAEGSWAVRVGSTDTLTEYGCAVNNAAGVVDIVVPIPAGKGFLVTLANVNDAAIGSVDFEAWVATSDYAGGGLIVDMKADDGNEEDRLIEASTMDMAYWSEFFVDENEPISSSDRQFFLDIPVGTYNMGVQDTSLTGEGTPPTAIHEEPFVAYYDQVDVPAVAYKKLTPSKDATKLVTASVDCAAGIEGADVFMNIAEGAGFLYYDLTPGVLAPGAYDGVLTFAVTPWMYWDMAIVQDSDPMNYFLIAQSFNATDREITFDLCKDGVDWVQPGMDRDWNSAKLELVPPSNLDTQYFDIFPGGGFDYVLDPIPYMSENIVLKIDPGCCGPDGDFAAQVLLDNFERDTPCCQEDCEPCGEFCFGGVDSTQDLNGKGGPKYGCDGCYDDIVVNGPATYEDYLGFLSCKGMVPEDLDLTYAKWWYLFVPETNPWAFGETILFGSNGLPLDLDVVSYGTIFGDGPFYMDPAGVSALEYDVAMLGGEVLHERGDWFDAAGNQIIAVLEPVSGNPFLVWGDDPDDANVETGKGLVQAIDSVAPVYPEYYLVSKMGTVVTLLDSSWDTTPFGPVTAIGRYEYSWWLQHGYLGDIEGHESEYVDVCCFDYSDCDQCEECEDGCKQICEIPHFWDGGWEIYAISPTDVRMNSEWGWSWVMALYEMELTTGYTATTYEPDMDVTRAEVAAFLGRLMKAQGLSLLGTATQFIDVPATHWAAQDILMLRDYGIVMGRDDDRFYPLDPVTRAEMTKMIQQTFRTLQNYGAWEAWWDVNWNIIPSGEIFADVPEGMWYTKYIEESYADLLVDGRFTLDEDKFFAPDDFVTRQEMAKFLVRAIQVDADTQGFWPSLAAEK